MMAQELRYDPLKQGDGAQPEEAALGDADKEVEIGPMGAAAIVALGLCVSVGMSVAFGACMSNSGCKETLMNSRHFIKLVIVLVICVCGSCCGSIFVAIGSQLPKDKSDEQNDLKSVPGPQV